MSTNPPAPPALPVPGAMLAGKYRVERILGQGGMGVVVAARHDTLGEAVALKFLRPEYASHAEASARFLREARAAVKIKSEHVARVSDVGTLDTSAPYMVMELLDGRDLARVLEAEGALDVADAVDYVIQGCEALAEAHALGIVHRDVKPANLFLTRRPSGLPLVKVLDFGISKVVGREVDNLTKTDASMGSALYMSPEQMQDTRSVDHRTDIYALGVTLYELLTGMQPFSADSLPQLCAAIFTGTPTPLRDLRPDVPEGLAAALEKAYARDRSARYPSVAHLVVALAPYAPARSRPTIESISRMGGIEAPVAGVLASTAVLPTPVRAQVLPASAAPPATVMASQAPGATDPGASVAPVPPRASLGTGQKVTVAMVMALAFACGALILARGSGSRAATDRPAAAPRPATTAANPPVDRSEMPPPGASEVPTSSAASPVSARTVASSVAAVTSSARPPQTATAAPPAQSARRDRPAPTTSPDLVGF